MLSKIHDWREDVLHNHFCLHNSHLKEQTSQIKQCVVHMGLCMETERVASERTDIQVNDCANTLKKLAQAQGTRVVACFLKKKVNLHYI